MIPSAELRLNTMVRAMTESILPAIDPENSLVQEQARLMIGHLQALLQQHGREAEINQQEYQDLTQLAIFLTSVADGGEYTKTTRNELMQALDSQSASLSLVIEKLITAPDATTEFKKSAWQPIMDYSEKSNARGRDWFKVMGF
ncbi:MAG: hypothetical protein M0Q95_03825 [Porticoccaceae bacterium]|nr:hypothetical protein [Porticoccaceae bacterium]